MSTAAFTPGLNLSPKQSMALDLDRDVSIRAGAGSGKTRTITEKIFGIIRGAFAPSAPDGGLEVLKKILCISFTNKAALELSERIMARLAEAAAECADPPLAAYFASAAERLDSLEIMTLDSFFTSVLRRFAFQLKLSTSFKPAAGGRADILFRKAVFNVLDSLSNGGPARGKGGKANIFDDFYSFYRKKDTIHGLFARILSKAVYLNDPIFTFGSKDEFEKHLLQETAYIEKTTGDLEFSAVLSFDKLTAAMDYLSSIANDLTGASQQKALGLLEAYRRVSAENAPASDFFKFALHGYKNVRYNKIEGGARLEELKLMIALVRDAAKKRFGAGETPPSADGRRLSKMEFDFFSGLCEIFDKCRAEYRRLKDAEDLLDFNDIEEKAREAAQDESIRDSISKQYRHILIDEFQDTNNLQADIIKLIKGSAKLTIVGDGMQSIYRFRNANCKLFSDFETDFACAGGLNVNLDDNYRSSFNVLSFINDFFGFLNFGVKHPFSDFKYSPLAALSDRAENRAVAVELGLFAVVSDRSSPETSGGMDESETPPPSAEGDAADAASEDGEDDEFDAGQFDFIARRAVALHEGEGCRYGEMMVLLSRMSRVDSLAAALSAAGAPFVITKSRRFFERPEVLDILNLVKTLVDPLDDLSMTGLLRSPIFAVADFIIFAVAQSFREIYPAEPFSIYAALKKLSAGALDFDRILAPAALPPGGYEAEKSRLTNVFNKIGHYAEMCRQKNAYDVLSSIYLDMNLKCKYSYEGDFGPAYKNIEKLFSHILENDYLPDGPMPVFLESFRGVVDINFAEEESQDGSSASDAIRIMTVHQAKGLEEKIVFIPELETDFFKAADTDVLVDDRKNLSFQPGVFVRLNERSLLKDYHEAVRKYERVQELFEKKRLLYVAMTRARELLVMSGSFKVNINKDGEIKASKLQKKPFMLSNCHLNWIVNFLGLDAGFFLDGPVSAGDGVKELKGNFGRVRVFLKPPPARETPPQAASPLSAAAEAGPKFDTARALNYKRLSSTKNASAVAVKLSYSDYRKLVEGPFPDVKAGPSSSSFDLASFLGDKKIAASPQPAGTDGETGTAFHRAVELALSSQLPLAQITARSKQICLVACRTASPSGAFPRAEVLRRVEKMFAGFLENAEQCGLMELFNSGGRGALRKYCELEMRYETENFILEGVCDLMTVGPDGAATLYDFKTASDIKAAVRDRMGEYERQLAFYQLCARGRFSGIASFNDPVVVLIQSGGTYEVKALRLLAETIEKKQAEIIKQCGELFK
jgi:ATP-dependent helicase/nuclease subunit A